MPSVAKFVEPKMTRLSDLQARLASRCNGEGKPKKGFTKNVGALQTEIRRLSAPTTTQLDRVATDAIDTGPVADVA